MRLYPGANNTELCPTRFFTGDPLYVEGGAPTRPEIGRRIAQWWQPYHGAIATVYQLLARGAAVLIFPEGGYSRGRRLRPLKKGVAHFALEAGVPICPVAVSGLDRLRPFGRVKRSSQIVEQDVGALLVRA